MQMVVNYFDVRLLPHIGVDSSSRHTKARFLALLIRKMYLVELEILDPTDRDSYNSKRIHAAGPSFAKSVKTYFNATIVQQIKRKLLRVLRDISYDKVDLKAAIESGIYSIEFERYLMQSVTSGNKCY
jgi:DNA-directed RNA polymerase beta subunit